jgi:hypothetical protein
MRKVYMPLLPFAILSYFLAYIDRINVSFAGLTMVAKGNACRASSRAMLTPVARYCHPRRRWSSNGRPASSPHSPAEAGNKFAAGNPEQRAAELFVA